MTDFAKYAFNKSHAAAYAVVSYQTAYLKYYYPVEFMAALMTSVIDNSTKVAEYIQVCRHMGIAVLPPNVNDGYAGFSVSGKDIRYGLSAIKSIGRSVIDGLVQEREENGKFKSLVNSSIVFLFLRFLPLLRLCLFYNVYPYNVNMNTMIFLGLLETDVKCLFCKKSSFFLV